MDCVKQFKELPSQSTAVRKYTIYPNKSSDAVCVCVCVCVCVRTLAALSIKRYEIELWFFREIEGETLSLKMRYLGKLFVIGKSFNHWFLITQSVNFSPADSPLLACCSE